MKKVNLAKICKDYSIKVISYQSAGELPNILGVNPSCPGCAIMCGDHAFILFDKECSEAERLFTVAHELGHIILGHLSCHNNKENRAHFRELEANAFAAVLIANDFFVGMDWRNKTMNEPQNVTFPITLDTFAALQKAEIGRELDPAEIELFAVAVDMANEAYTAVCCGQPEVVKNLLDTINKAEQVTLTTQESKHYAAICRGWLLLACRHAIKKLGPTDTLPSCGIDPVDLREVLRWIYTV